MNPSTPETVSYLGPAGTFTHAAALAFAKANDSLLALPSAVAVVRSVENDEATTGVVAFESSLEGDVSLNLDELLLRTQHCLIADELILPVTFTVFRALGDESPLIGVSSHLFALAQCSQFIESEGLQTRETASTAAACLELDQTPIPGWGALAPPTAARTYKLYTQIDFIENEAGAVTRFVALRRTCAPASGHDRSAFAVRPQRDEPGSLVRFLQEFAFHGVNLTAIKSHPTREALGEYVFYIECEGHITQPRLRDVVTGILRLQPQTRFLGSFPEDKARPQQRDPHQGALLQNLDSTYLQMLGRVKSRA